MPCGHSKASNCTSPTSTPPRTAVVALDGALDDRRPQWSPDGKTLLFERYAGESFQLAVASVDGGPVTLIGPERPGNSGGSHARFSPDGTRVLAYYESDGSSWVLDPVDGIGRPAL